MSASGGMSRRQFLAVAGSAAAVVAFESCSGGNPRHVAKPRPSPPSSTTTTTMPRPAGTRPDLTHPAGTDLLPEIEHIVVVMQENHSYDSYFGMLPRGDAHLSFQSALAPEACTTRAHFTVSVRTKSAN